MPRVRLSGCIEEENEAMVAFDPSLAVYRTRMDLLIIVAENRSFHQASTALTTCPWTSVSR